MDKPKPVPSKLPAVLGLIQHLVFAGFDRNKPINQLSELVFSGTLERHDEDWVVIVGDRRLDIKLHAKLAAQPELIEWTSGRVMGRLFVRSNSEAELLGPITLGYAQFEDAQADDLRLVARGRLVKLDLDEGLMTLRVNPLARGLNQFELTMLASLELMNKLHPGRGYEITGKLRGNVLTATRATRATLLEKPSRQMSKQVAAPPLPALPEDLLARIQAVQAELASVTGLSLEGLVARFSNATPEQLEPMLRLMVKTGKLRLNELEYQLASKDLVLEN